MSTTATCVSFRYWEDPAGPHDAAASTVVIELEGTGPDEHIFKLICAHSRFYESDLLEHLACHGPRGGVFVDVGANIGNHSVFFGRFLADRVVAIEPDPALLPLLERNLRANRVARWTTVPVAIGALPGTGRLVTREGYEGNAGAQRVIPGDEETEGPNGRSVRIDTIDRVLCELGPETAEEVRLVKLDIEGMELAALHGATGLLDRQKPDVVVEAASKTEHAEVASFLSSHGYCEIGQFCRTPTYHFSNPSRPFPRGRGTTGGKGNP